MHAQQGYEISQTPAEAGGQLQVTQQEHGNQGGPDLSLNRIQPKCPRRS